VFALHDSIPRNKYGLQVISSVRLYRHLQLQHQMEPMVAVEKYVQPLVCEWFYATQNNFTKRKLYRRPTAFVRRSAAEALQKVQEDLKPLGLSLKFFDAYRPYSVTEKMWKVVPDDRYAANPAKGSGHNRGAAIDVTLINLVTRQELDMPTTFDDFTAKAHHNYMSLEKTVLANRELLRSSMEKHGFKALDTEWWHYYLPNAADRYALMNLSFRQMRRVAGGHPDFTK